MSLLGGRLAAHSTNVFSFATLYGLPYHLVRHGSLSLRNHAAEHVVTLKDCKYWDIHIERDNVKTLELTCLLPSAVILTSVEISEESVAFRQ